MAFKTARKRRTFRSTSSGDSDSGSSSSSSKSSGGSSSSKKVSTGFTKESSSSGDYSITGNPETDAINRQKAADIEAKKDVARRGGSSPTVLTDANIREKVIPDLNSRAKSLLGSGPTADSLKQGSGTDTIGESSLPSIEEIYKQFYGGEEGLTDPLYKDSLRLIQSMEKNVDAETAAYLNAIKGKFNVREQQLVESQRAQTKGVENALLLGGAAGSPGGSSRYAPISSSGILSAKTRFDVQALVDLQAEEEMLMADVRKARDDRKYQLMEKKLGILEEKRTEKLAQARKISDALTEESLAAREKQIQATRDSAVSGLLTQGVTNPAQILEMLNYDESGRLIGDFTAKEVADAVSNLVASKSYPGGIVGEYQFYVDQEESLGKVPVDFNTYQNMDANRKAAIARAGIGATGLDSWTLMRVQAIANGFGNEQSVKNFQVVAEGKAFLDSIDDNTVNPADQQGVIYAFAKIMDPNSVVREGEYNTVQKYAQSWASTFGFSAQRIFSNKPFLTAQAIKNMKATINSRVAASENSYQNIYSEYGRRINQLTGQSDGTDYLTSYASGFPTEDSPNIGDIEIQIENLYKGDERFREIIDPLYEKGFSDLEIHEYLSEKGLI